MSTNVDIEMQHDILLTQATTKSSTVKPKIALAAGLLLVVGALGTMTMNSTSDAAEAKSTQENKKVTTDLKAAIATKLEDSEKKNGEAKKDLIVAKVELENAGARLVDDIVKNTIAKDAKLADKNVDPAAVKELQKDMAKTVQRAGDAILDAKAEEKNGLKATAEVVDKNAKKIEDLGKAALDLSKAVAGKSTTANTDDKSTDLGLQDSLKAINKKIEAAEIGKTLNTVKGDLKEKKLNLEAVELKMAALTVDAAKGTAGPAEVRQKVQDLVEEENKLKKIIKAELTVADNLANKQAKVLTEGNKSDKAAVEKATTN